MRGQALLCLLTLAFASPCLTACLDENCFEENVSISLLQTALKVSRPAVEVQAAPVVDVPLYDVAAIQKPSLRERAGMALAEAWDALPRGTMESTHILLMAVTAALTTFGMAMSFMKTEGKSKSLFRLVAQPISSQPKAKGKPALPPWDVHPSKVGEKYMRKAKDTKKGDARARQRAKVLKAVPLPPLSLDTVLSEDCFIVDMDGLAQLCNSPLDIKDVSGNTLLHAAVSESVDGQQLLQLTLTGNSDGPHAIVYGVGGSGTMTLFGIGGCEYGSIVPQLGGGSQLVRAGQTAMQLQAGFPADLRIMALNADSDFVASGGRYLGVRRGKGTGDVWKLKVCSGVDSLLVVACMLATILKSTPAPCADPVEDSNAMVEMDSECQDSECQDPVESGEDISNADQAEPCLAELYCDATIASQVLEEAGDESS